jgi:Fic family protein
MAEFPTPLTPEELAALDARYVPFPDFEEWTQLAPFAAAWASRTADLNRQDDANSEAVEDARGVAVRAAAWDTGAIEGLYTTDRGVTMTIAMEAAGWQSEIASHGANAEALFDAQLATYELVLDVATQRQPVTEAWLRRVHEELTRPQETYTVHTPDGTREEPLLRGQYKTRPNHVQQPDGTRHPYAPVAMTAPEMHRLVQELSSDAFANGHPMLQAAYSHYAITVVHPFADGNGRVARAIASVYLYRAARVPLIIFAADRDTYLAALRRADARDYDGFATYMATAAVESVELILDALTTRAAPDVNTALEQFRDMLTVQEGLTHVEIDGFAASLLSQFAPITSEEVAKLKPPRGVSISSVQTGTSPVNPPDAYRNVSPSSGNAEMIRISFTAEHPSRADRLADFRIFISMASDDVEFWIVQWGTENGAKFSLRSVFPQLTPAAGERLRLLAQRTLGSEMHLLLADARNAFEAAGYPASPTRPDT